MAQRYLLNVMLTDIAKERLRLWLQGQGFQVEWGEDYVLLSQPLTVSQKNAIKNRILNEFFEEG